MDNPLLKKTAPLPFAAVKAEHVLPAIHAHIAEAQAKLDAIAAIQGERTFDNTLWAFERAGEGLEYAWNIVDMLEAVQTSPELRAAYNEAQGPVADFYSKIFLSAPLYRALKEFAATREAQALQGPKKRYLDLTLREFRRQGAELADAGKARLEELNRELATITTRFSQNVLDATNSFEILIEDEARLKGLPESAKEAARQSAAQKGKPGYRFTLQAPSYMAVMRYLDERSTREQMYRAYNERAVQEPLNNAPLIKTILTLRKEKATLLGYHDFPDFVLEERMAKRGAEARRFVQEMRERVYSFSDKEHAALVTFAEKLGFSQPLMPWDVTYFAEKLRKSLYDFDAEELRPYFPLEQVLSGLFECAKRLYGITVEPVSELPVWDAQVRTYRVAEGNGALIGHFYADLFPRESKRGGAWMNSLRMGLWENGNEPREPHIGFIGANFTPPVGDKPSLLTFQEVETLFHEFGHLLHQLLCKPRIPSLGGTNVAWDFVELPSQLMENWCWEHEVLSRIARHYENGSALPEPLYKKLLDSKNFRAASTMLFQCGLATTDLLLHTEYDDATHGEPVRYAKEIFAAFSPVPLPESYAMITSFTHLFAGAVAYGSGYYSYQWAEVLDADVFSRFEREGIFNGRLAGELREKILARGNEDEAMNLFVSFMGRTPDPAAALKRAGLV